jgi:hypothetical protein
MNQEENASLLLSESHGSINLAETTRDNQLYSTFTAIQSEMLPEVVTRALGFFESQKMEAAREALAQHLNDTKGATHQLIWFMLMDFYAMDQNKQAFEKIAEQFAKKFNVTPPAWTEPTVEEESGITGRNSLILTGGMSSEINDKIKDFIRQSRTAGQCLIEFRAVDLDKSSEAGLSLVVGAMQKIRHTKIRAKIVGEEGCLAAIRKKMEELESVKRAVWLLYFEILQWSGEAGEFDYYALEYTRLFDISPPGFDEGGVAEKYRLVVKKKTKMPMPPKQLSSEERWEEWWLKLVAWKKEEQQDVVIVPFQHVTHISVEVMDAWVRWIRANPLGNEGVFMLRPSHWVLAMLWRQKADIWIRCIGKNVLL